MSTSPYGIKADVGLLRLTPTPDVGRYLCTFLPWVKRRARPERDTMLLPFREPNTISNKQTNTCGPGPPTAPSKRRALTWVPPGNFWIWAVDTLISPQETKIFPTISHTRIRFPSLFLLFFRFRSDFSIGTTITIFLILS